jgi:inward rectifier potassium channel
MRHALEHPDRAGSRVKRPPDPNEVELVGVRPAPLRDLYYTVLSAPWWLDALGALAVFLLANVAFALAYDAIGGIGGVAAAERTFGTYFFFSVQTMATIGYGQMFPQSTAAHVLVTAEAIVGLGLVALTTGLIFSKFAAPRARVRFASAVVISPMDGVPTLMIRLGNERQSRIVDAQVRLTLVRTEHTAEGVRMYRSYDLALDRQRALALSRSWTVLHKLVEGSLLLGASPESLARDEVELTISVIGLDEATGQTLHAYHTYLDGAVRFGARHADLLFDRPDGGLRMELSHFDEVVATQPTSAFPYPRV